MSALRVCGLNATELILYPTMKVCSACVRAQCRPQLLSADGQKFALRVRRCNAAWNYLYYLSNTSDLRVRRCNGADNHLMLVNIVEPTRAAV